MQTEHKDHKLKYLDMPREFYLRANSVNIACKSGMRSCESLAKSLVGMKPKNTSEFENIEKMKDFVLKTAAAHEETLELLTWMQALLQGIMADTETLVKGAEIRNQLRDQSDNIEILIQEREQAIKAIYELRQNQGNTK